MDQVSTGKTRRAAPWRGRRRVSDPRGRFIGVRCTPEEYARINDAASKSGDSVGAFLRRVALGDPGVRAIRRPPIERRELARFLGWLGKLGSNVNQIAHAYNRDRRAPASLDIAAIREDVAAMRAALMKALGHGD